MAPQEVLTLGQQALWTGVIVAAPLMLTALAVGLVVSVLQAATQINEQTLSFLPKLVAMIVTLVITGPWMLAYYTDFMRRLFESIPSAVSQT